MWVCWLLVTVLQLVVQTRWGRCRLSLSVAMEWNKRPETPSMTSRRRGESICVVPIVNELV